MSHLAISTEEPGFRKHVDLLGVPMAYVNERPFVRQGLAFLTAAATAATLAACSQTYGRHAMNTELDGTWVLLSGQPLPEGARDIKMLSGGHFMFAAYDTQTGEPLYAAGGSYTLNGNDYVEHMDFASDKIAAGLVGKNQSFTVTVEGDTFTQKGTLSNGKPLTEKWKRIS
jgi:hypothetical protein